MFAFLLYYLCPMFEIEVLPQCQCGPDNPTVPGLERSWTILGYKPPQFTNEAMQAQALQAHPTDPGGGCPRPCAFETSVPALVLLTG